MFYAVVIAVRRLVPPLAVKKKKKNQSLHENLLGPSLLEMSHYSIVPTVSPHYVLRRCGRDMTVPAFACALYMWQVDGSPWLWTLPVIRTQMALQWLIIDAANMWQLLINTHASWMVETRTALMIHLKPRRGWGGGRWEGGRGREEKERNLTLEAKVCCHIQNDVFAARRWQWWIVSIMRRIPGKRAGRQKIISSVFWL